MYGIDAISQFNGWAMAVAGALIVISGLAVLSFVISRLHKIVALIDTPQHKKDPAAVQPGPTTPPRFIPDSCPANITEAAHQYQPLVDQLENQFKLSDLYEKALQAQLPHPHLTIRCLRQAGTLIPIGDGIFKWSKP